MLRQSWTTAIHDLIETLTCRVRVLSLQHVQRLWSQSDESSTGVTDVLQSLIDADLIIGDVWKLPVCPIGTQPLYEWSPGQSAPDCLRLESLVQDRWDRPDDSVPVVAATHAAARMFGSQTGGLPPAHHRGHDLLLAAVYVRYRERQPQLAGHWLGEDAVATAERGVKNPDAYLCDGKGNTIRVIESAGRYSQKQLESLHEHCRLAGLAYELW